MAGYATSGRGWHDPAVAGLLRRDERVHAQSIKLVDCLCRVIASIGGHADTGSRPHADLNSHANSDAGLHRHPHVVSHDYRDPARTELPTLEWNQAEVR